MILAATVTARGESRLFVEDWENRLISAVGVAYSTMEGWTRRVQGLLELGRRVEFVEGFADDEARELSSLSLRSRMESTADVASVGDDAPRLARGGRVGPGRLDREPTPERLLRGEVSSESVVGRLRGGRSSSPAPSRGRPVESGSSSDSVAVSKLSRSPRLPAALVLKFGSIRETRRFSRLSSRKRRARFLGSLTLIALKYSSDRLR